MAGKIPRAFIEDLVARIDLVDLIDARIPLKRSGANYSARCPFHSEKTPSFSVSREKQFYHCFGCGAHGNAINFLMEYDRLSFVEAVEWLADSAGLSVPVESEGRGVRQEEQGPALQGLYEVQEKAARFYAAQLRAHPGGERAVAYLKERGLEGETARRFLVGYAPPGWRSLPENLGSPEQLLAAGLAIRNEQGGIYDRFRDRIMFPIRDRRGRVIAFGGRVLGEGTPKYLNSPETAVFVKHRELYGLHELLAALRKPERILVAEGYMDVISLAQAGVINAVATLGTATSAEHVKTLFRFCREVIFCFDGDRAGHSAAWKALDASLPAMREGRSVRFLMLPDGQDPDSLVQAEGKAEFERRMDAAAPLSDYFFAQLAERHELGAMEGRAALIGEAKPLLEKLPESVYRDMMYERLGDLAGRSQVPIGSKSTKLERKPGLGRTERTRPSALRVLVALLLQRPSLVSQIDDPARTSLVRLEKGGTLISKLLALINEKPDITAGGIVERFRGDAEENQVKALLVWDAMIPPEGVEAEFGDALRKVLKQEQKDRLDALLSKVEQTKLSAEELEEMKALLADR
ncbi:DNA primase [Methyloterricola oryzae]|uniref:DNA primase n=1 Tax=Methyloterricola oryzae TaxID=1495050 RepID=UPI0005EB4822|nr:DNA primase [Methyloterricola oryzae]